jgi:U3 small nucleolar RNA-associated protein 15
VHGIKYSAPVLSMAMSPNNTHLVVGMANGTLSIRHKPAQAATAALVFQV